ncbi:MAG: response regulator [Planctomycetes bacterium]|nr:response regulator [Planctomycetota bacterium]
MKRFRFNISAKVSLLASTLVIFTSFVLANQILRIAKDEVIDHEIVDLADETNLLANELLNDVSLLRRDIWQLARLPSVEALAAGGEDAAAAGEPMPEATAATPSRAGNEDPLPTTLQELQAYFERFLAERPSCLMVELLSVSADGEASELVPPICQPRIAAVAPAFDRRQFLAQAFAGQRHAELSPLRGTGITYAGRTPFTTESCAVRAAIQTGLYQPGDSADDDSAADRKDVVVVTMLLDRLADMHFSPRHLVFVIDSEGRFPVHPDASRVLDAADTRTHTLAEDAPALRRGREELNKLESGAAESSTDLARRRRGYTLEDSPADSGAVTRDRGAAGYAFLFQASEPVANGQPHDFQERLLRLRSVFPDCGFTATNQTPPEIKVRAGSRKRLRELQAGIEQAIGRPLDWKTDVVECDELLMHFNRLRYDPDDQSRFVDLAVAVAREELASSIDATLSEVSWWALMLTLGGVCAAILFSGIITRPLKKITASTERVARGEMNVDLPTGDKGEIGELARAFRHMIHEVEERNLALKELNKDLDRRVRVRTAELERSNLDLLHARDAAEEANRIKSQFLANMSHELRTPLNAVIGYSELLQEELADAGREDCLDDLEKINDAGKHLLTLINDILDLSKIEAGRVELELTRFDLAGMLQDTVTTIRPVVEKKGNTLVLECPETIGEMCGDVTRLRQCLFNLLSNAGKFTQDGTIALDVRRDRTDGRDWLTFRVTDTGIGMTPEQLKRLFQAFNQADVSTTRKYGGTGLGLAISQKLAQLMGGTILVDSRVGEGTTFTMRLPAQAPGGEAATAAGMPPVKTVERLAAELPDPKAGSNTVLVVDDDAGVRDMLERFLGREGFHVVTCERGQDVLETARRVRPQAITLDVMMPGVDGWAVMSQLKSDPELADVPVVMLTIVDDKNMGYALGAADYLTKPLDRERLLHTLGKYCNVTSPGLALVVEDDASSRELLRRTLERDGWSVVEASNGRQALECVSNKAPSLILLDLMMPEMDGFEFLDELRHHPQWQKIPVVVITAKELTEEDRMFLNGSLFLSGCVKRVLQKGRFSRQELLEEVRELVGSPAV